MKSPPFPARSCFPPLTLGMARAEGVDLLGWVKEEGLDVMRPLGIFLENCRSFSAWEIWAIWINRVKLHVGSDAVARGSLASPKELGRAADQCTKAFSRRCIPSLPRFSRHGQCCRCFSSSSPSICLPVCIRRRGRQRWPWVNAWDLACVRGQGLVITERVGVN